MTTKEIIEMLRVCADDDIICPACPRYEQYEYGGTAECHEKMMQEAAIREQEQRRWIPVTERLPEYGQEVLVYTGNILKPIVMAYTFWRKDYDTWLHVTHWMPLPPAPEDMK